MEGVDFNRKYRPTTLATYLGNETRVALSKRFKRNLEFDAEGKHYFPNVCLFTGGSGTGKTTAARIIAKQYLCESPTEDGYACGKCTMCEEIEENLMKGNFGDSVMGVTELDIATDSGKGKVMSVLEELMYPPMPPANFNIVILDECHMATNQLQNSLLKLLEEPPDHLVFMLCTTNPEKLLDTVLSRVQYRIEIRKATIDDLVDRMELICVEEGIDYSRDALRYIVTENRRVPRACLHMLSAIAQSSSKVTLDVVAAYGGGVSTDLVVMYYQHVQKGLADILSYMNYLKENDIDLNDFFKTLVKVTLDAINIKHGLGLGNYLPDYVKGISFILKGYAVDDIMYMINNLSEHSSKDFNSSTGFLNLITLSLKLGRHLKVNVKEELMSAFNLLADDSNNVKIENSQAIAKYAEYLKDSAKTELSETNITIDNVTDILNIEKANISSDSIKIETVTGTGDINTDQLLGMLKGI